MTDIKEIFRAFGHELGQALGESMLESVRAQLPRLRAELGVPDDTRRPASTRGAKVSQALTRPCPVDGCARQGRGPRYSFLCEVHRDMPAAEREKYRIRARR
jgi:hypothetical protein